VIGTTDLQFVSAAVRSCASSSTRRWLPALRRSPALAARLPRSTPSRPSTSSASRRRAQCSSAIPHSISTRSPPRSRRALRGATSTPCARSPAAHPGRACSRHRREAATATNPAPAPAAGARSDVARATATLRFDLPPAAPAPATARGVRRARPAGARPPGGTARAGRFEVSWDLRSDAGTRVADGLYFARLSFAGFRG
jgi:hypothetical protein